MPQLEFMSWFFNFLIGWLILIMVFLLMMKKNEYLTSQNSSSRSLIKISKNKWLWT